VSPELLIGEGLFLGMPVAELTMGKRLLTGESLLLAMTATDLLMRESLAPGMATSAELLMGECLAVTTARLGKALGMPAAVAGESAAAMGSLEDGETMAATVAAVCARERLAVASAAAMTAERPHESLAVATTSATVTLEGDKAAATAVAATAAAAAVRGCRGLTAAVTAFLATRSC